MECESWIDERVAVAVSMLTPTASCLKTECTNVRWKYLNKQQNIQGFGLTKIRIFEVGRTLWIKSCGRGGFNITSWAKGYGRRYQGYQDLNVHHRVENYSRSRYGGSWNFGSEILSGRSKSWSTADGWMFLLGWDIGGGACRDWSLNSANKTEIGDILQMNPLERSLQEGREWRTFLRDIK